jgi:NADH dehydrogenase
MVRDHRRAEREARLGGLSVEWIEADVTRPETLAAAMTGVETVIHTVAIAVETGERTYERINLQGTANILRAAAEYGARRFINMSQLGAAPDLPYRFLASKGNAQTLVAGSGLDWTAFRPSVIWGPEDEFANTFARLAQMTPLIFPIVGDGQSKFEPVWIEDVVTSVEASLEDKTTYGMEFELGGPEVLTMEQIERRTLAALGARRAFIRFPIPLIRVAVWLMETLLPSPPVTRSLLELLAVDNVTQDNAISRFVASPRPFTSENIQAYVRRFSVGRTLAQFMGK